MKTLVSGAPGYTPTPFEPPAGFANAHAQTVFGELAPRRLSKRHEPWRGARREVLIALADGDRLQAFLHEQPDDPRHERPIVLHLHGLEGSAEAHYQVGLSAKAFAAGFHSIRINFRNCGDTEHLARSLYTGRHTGDLLSAIEILRSQHGFRRFLVTGVSLGAALLLRTLADAGEHPPEGLMGAVAISPAIDYPLTSVAFSQGFNRFYAAYFLRLLKRKMRRKLRLSPGGSELRPIIEAMRQVKTLRQFDEVVTAPLCGYADPDAYYAAASCADELEAIRVPTLFIHAKDDPFVVYSMYAGRWDAFERNAHLTGLFPDHGGHVGFFERAGVTHAEPWMDRRWAENEAIAYLMTLS